LACGTKVLDAIERLALAWLRDGAIRWPLG
jgi:hypothetical protein